jgi:hypothetical protein
MKYRFVRHPMYSAVIPLLVGMSLWLGSFARHRRNRANGTDRNPGDASGEIPAPRTPRLR